jgi:hypothetical protein
MKNSPTIRGVSNWTSGQVPATAEFSLGLSQLLFDKVANLIERHFGGRNITGIRLLNIRQNIPSCQHILPKDLLRFIRFFKQRAVS